MSEKQTYGLDSVGLLSYFVNKLGEAGDMILTDAESNKVRILIPSIVIGESIYTILKGKVIFGSLLSPEKIEHILDVLYESPIFIIKDLEKIGWKNFLQSKISELHDRIIVSTCVQEGVTELITKNQEIMKSKEIKTIW